MDSPTPDPDRYTGCLLGVAAGDALGTTLEFKSPGIFEPISGMVGGGPFNLWSLASGRTTPRWRSARRRAC